MANTENRKVSWKKVPVRHCAFHKDSFTIRCGHVVGHDGFVVPKNFEEFYRRFPTYVTDWVRKRVRGRASEPEAEDWTQELLLHLAALPNHSVWRRRGKNDVIQTFSPERMHGANEARFRSFLNNCLTNKFNTVYAKWRKRPLSNPANLPFGPERATEASDEYCHAHSLFLRKSQERVQERRKHDERLVDFVRQTEEHVPGITETIRVFRLTGSWEESASLLRVSLDRIAAIRREAQIVASHNVN